MHVFISAVVPVILDALATSILFGTVLIFAGLFLVSLWAERGKRLLKVTRKNRYTLTGVMAGFVACAFLMYALSALITDEGFGAVLILLWAGFFGWSSFWMFQRSIGPTKKKARVRQQKQPTPPPPDTPRTLHADDDDEWLKSLRTKP